MTACGADNAVSGRRDNSLRCGHTTRAVLVWSSGESGLLVAVIAAAANSPL